MGIDLPIASADVMTIGYCLWYPPDADPEAIQSEVEQQVAYAAHTDPWLRENPPRLDWGLHWIANDPGADELTATLAAAQERAAAGTRFAGPATINGFPAVEDASYLTAGGTPAISYGPGDLSVAHAPDEFVLIDELLCATRAFALLAMAWCGVAAS
jgi:acetylornithine deacetylase